MSDITMCFFDECPLKDKCTRHTADRGEYQSIFMDMPYDKQNNKCEYFWNNNYKRNKNVQKNR